MYDVMNINIFTSNSHPKNPEEPAWRFTTSYFIEGPAWRLLLIIEWEFEVLYLPFMLKSKAVDFSVELKLFLI